MIEINRPEQLVQFALAGIAVRYAAAFLPLVRQHLGTETATVAFGAVCGYYARPFSGNHGFERLTIDVVPQELRSVHDEIILLRNKVFMHSDMDASINGEAVNNFEFVSDGKRVIIHNLFPQPPVEKLDEVTRLLAGVDRVVHESINRCLNNGVPSRTTFPKGKLRLNLSGGVNWFQPF